MVETAHAGHKARSYFSQLMSDRTIMRFETLGWQLAHGMSLPQMSYCIIVRQAIVERRERNRTLSRRGAPVPMERSGEE